MTDIALEVSKQGIYGKTDPMHASLKGEVAHGRVAASIEPHHAGHRPKERHIGHSEPGSPGHRPHEPIGEDSNVYSARYRLSFTSRLS